MWFIIFNKKWLVIRLNWLFTPGSVNNKIVFFFSLSMFNKITNIQIKLLLFNVLHLPMEVVEVIGRITFISQHLFDLHSRRVSYNFNIKQHSHWSGHFHKNNNDVCYDANCRHTSVYSVEYYIAFCVETNIEWSIKQWSARIMRSYSKQIRSSFCSRICTTLDH